MADSLKKLKTFVILDLDGTLLNTDAIMIDILKEYLIKYGKQWDGRTAHEIAGKTPSQAAAFIVEHYKLPLSTDRFISEINPMFSDQWGNIKALPGADRLIKHLKRHGVRIALASNSPRAGIEIKISNLPGWKESFSVIVGGDEVAAEKPSPLILFEAAKRLGADPSSCLVIEDSLHGVMAGKAAGMEVVAVPSIPKQSHLFTPLFYRSLLFAAKLLKDLSDNNLQFAGEQPQIHVLETDFAFPEFSICESVWLISRDVGIKWKVHGPTRGHATAKIVEASDKIKTVVPMECGGPIKWSSGRKLLVN